MNSSNMTVSYWLDRPYTASPPLSVDTTADAAIVGAGMTGIGLARFLRALHLRVLVLECDTVAGGASGRNAGLVVSGLGEHYARSVEFWGRERAAAISRMHLQNHALLAELVAEDGINCEYARNGSFVIAADAEEEEWLRRSHPLMLEDGFPCEFLESQEVNTTLRTCGFGGGIFTPSDGQVDPVGLTRGLAAAARRRGVGIFEHARVRDIRKAGSSWTIEAGQGKVTAPLVFLATNAWTPVLLPGIELRAVRGQCLAAGPSKDPPPDVPCYTNYGSEYWRGAGSCLILGGMQGVGGAAEFGCRDEVTAPVQNELDRFRSEHFPKLRDVPVRLRWSGIMSYTADGLPVLGAVPGKEGMYLAAGYTGHGFGYSFLAARWLVRLAFEGIDEIPALCRMGRKMTASPALRELHP